MKYDQDSPFPSGVVIFFRLMATDNTLARSVHTTARFVKMGVQDAHDDDYIVTDAEDRFLGSYPREFVAAILPLETTGPGATADVGDTKNLTRN